MSSHATVSTDVAVNSKAVRERAHDLSRRLQDPRVQAAEIKDVRRVVLVQQVCALEREVPVARFRRVEEYRVNNCISL